jgi:F0F1-type ATP synthase membrane subunit a
MKKRKPQGIQFAIVCLVFGVAAAVANTAMYFNGKVFPVLLAVTPFLLLAGISLLTLPGANPPDEVPDNQRIGHWWKNSAGSAKAVWISSAIAGLAIGVWMMFTFTNFSR